MKNPWVSQNIGTKGFSQTIFGHKKIGWNMTLIAFSTKTIYVSTGIYLCCKCYDFWFLSLFNLKKKSVIPPSQCLTSSLSLIFKFWFHVVSFLRASKKARALQDGTLVPDNWSDSEKQLGRSKEGSLRSKQKTKRYLSKHL